MRGRLRYRFLRWLCGYSAPRIGPETARELAQRCHENIVRPDPRIVDLGRDIASIMERINAQSLLGPYRIAPLWDVDNAFSLPLEERADDRPEEFNRYVREESGRIVIEMGVDDEGRTVISEIHDTGEEITRRGPEQVTWNDAEYYRRYNPRFFVDLADNGLIRDHPVGRPDHEQIRTQTDPGPTRQWTGPNRCQGRYCTCPACAHDHLIREAELRRIEQEMRSSYDPRSILEPYAPGEVSWSVPEVSREVRQRYEYPGIMRYIPPYVSASRPPGDGRDRYNMHDLRRFHVYLGGGNRLGPHCHLTARISPGRYAIQRQIPLGGWITLSGKDSYDTSDIAVRVAEQTSETHDYPTRVVDKNLHEAVWPEEQKGAKC
jgi:hypothetical protein